jgi:hypothetical protein
MVAIEAVECVASAATGADNCVAVDRPFPAILAKRSAVDLDAEPTTTGRTAHTLMRSPNCCCDHAKYQGLARDYASIANRQAFQWNTWGPEKGRFPRRSRCETLCLSRRNSALIVLT